VSNKNYESLGFSKAFNLYTLFFFFTEQWEQEEEDDRDQDEDEYQHENPEKRLLCHVSFPLSMRMKVKLLGQLNLA